MSDQTTRWFVLVAVVLGLTAGKCDEKETPTSDAGTTADAGGGASGNVAACYVETQQRCKELPSPSNDQRANLQVECSSVSGVYGSTCPTAAFVGKCIVLPAAGTKDGPEVRRFYTGRDVAYERDFCVNTAYGTWSTTF